MSQLVSRKIPTTMNPWVCSINNVPFAYPAGTVQMVPEEVAQIIDSYNDYNKPPEAPEPGSQMGGADWNAKEGEPGHIKNKPEFEWIATSKVTEAEIVPEQTVVFERAQLTFMHANNLTDLLPYAPILGEKYIVAWNGTEYECEGKELVYGPYTMPYLGNAALNDGLENTVDTGEPFIYVYADVWGTSSDILINVAESDLGEKTFSITHIKDEAEKMPGKFLPEGVPHIEDGGMVEILPECQPMYVADDNRFIVEQPIALVAGETYTVSWNGKEYSCVCQDLSAMQAGALALGDWANFGGSGNGEPFMLATIPGAGVMIVPLDGSTTLTVAIYVGGKTYHKMDNRLLDLDWVPILKEKYVIPERTSSFESTNEVDGHTFYTASIDLGEALEIPAGEQKKYVICLDGVKHTAKSMPESNTILADDRSAYIHPTGGTTLVEAGVEEPGFHTIALIDPAQSQTDRMPEELLPESVDGVVIRSSTVRSTKKFLLTVNDSGTISATEIA